MSAYDCIVLGVGAMGAATCLALARRGLRVIGLEQAGLAHDRGSSHGQTRIIRKAYFEHPDYVPLLHRAYTMWDELAHESGHVLFERVGLLMLGVPGSEVLAGVRSAAHRHSLAIHDLSSVEVRARFPGFAPPSDMNALFEADAGFLHAERCVRAMAELATAHGATLRFDESVVSWRAGNRFVEVETAVGAYRAERLVVTAGAWTSRLLADLRVPLVVLRKVQIWFPADERYRAERGCPVFCADMGDAFFYGAPVIAERDMKIAEHSGRESADPDSVDRRLHPCDFERVAEFARNMLPGVTPTPVRHAACLYTMSPDGQFLLDRHPEHDSVCFAAGFSGHGFKFAPLIGSVMADLAIDGQTRDPVGFLALSRFTRQ